MNILSFDLEDWFHILNHPSVASASSWESKESRIEKNTNRILDLLEERKLKATFFCLGWIAKKYPSIIKKIALIHELGCHSMEHHLLYKMDRTFVSNDVHENISVVEQLTGKKVLSYRAPGFSFTEQTKWLIPVLAEAGIEYDCSVFPAKRNHGGYATFPIANPCRITFDGVTIKEFPMNLGSLLWKKIVFSGGGYFRVLPYPMIRAMMRSDYVMTYFHPRDFDPGQPVLQGLSFKRKFMSYTGLKKSFLKLNRLLNEHTFISVEEAGKQIDWTTTPEVNLDLY